MTGGTGKTANFLINFGKLEGKYCLFADDRRKIGNRCQKD